MGNAEDGVGGDLVQAHPQAQVVGREAPTVAELVEVRGHDDELVVGGSRDGQVVLAERSLREVADHRARRHPQHRRADHLHQRRHPGHRVGGTGWFVGNHGLVVVERSGELLEQRSVGVERLLGPLRPGDRHDGDAPPGDRRRQPGGVGDLEVGDPGELLDLDPLERIDVGFAGGGVAGGDRQGELAGGIPVDRALLLEQLGQVAEDRHALERVVVAERVVAGTAREAEVAHREHGRRVPVPIRPGPPVIGVPARSGSSPTAPLVAPVTAPTVARCPGPWPGRS
jgi:hypothetical protein